MVTRADTEEIFAYPAIREVAFEIRFGPRLRIIPEVWRIQDNLAEAYPTVTQETNPQPDGRHIQTYVFGNPERQRHVKVSEENFLVVFNTYGSFEEFKAETLNRVNTFCAQFDVKTFNRVGLRYVNHIELKSGEGIEQLRRFVNLPIDFDRVNPSKVEQFLTEFRAKAGEHKIIVRGALLQLPTRPVDLLYILDLDSYTSSPTTPSMLPSLLDEFHGHIQTQFLEHVREDYKQVMRGKS